MVQYEAVCALAMGAVVPKTPGRIRALWNVASIPVRFACIRPEGVPAFMCCARRTRKPFVPTGDAGPILQRDQDVRLSVPGLAGIWLRS